jgi:hypothetical protein
MLSELSYAQRKAARRNFRKKVEAFVRKGELLANSCADLEVLIVIHSKELNQIVDFCNCNATDLISRYEASISCGPETDNQPTSSSQQSQPIPLHPIQKQKRQAAAEAPLKQKRPKLSTSHLSSTMAETEVFMSPSRSPISRPRSPCNFGFDFEPQPLELYGVIGQPTTQATAVGTLHTGFSPHKPTDKSFWFDGTSVLVKSPSYQSFSGSDKDLWARTDEDLFDNI